MLRRIVGCLGVVGAGLAVLSVAAGAAGPPPPPTSTNGKTVQVVARGLKTPTAFAFGAGVVFEGDGGNSTGSAPPNGAVYVLKGGGATALADSPAFVGGLIWHDNALFISGGVLTGSGPQFEILKWSGWNGTAFSSHTVVWKAPKKLNGLNGIGFGANGRLYVGVDLGLTNNNDHGPASLTPDLYDILSMSSTGKDVKVFASGIRQPWQMAFTKGSNSPYVTDLGQDSHPKNPPDFILHVKAGDNYGFPKCNQTNASACAGYAKPLTFLSPHTDPGGIAISGGRIYISEFGFTKIHPPEVVSFPLSGKGKAKILLTGFVAPVIGMNISGGYLYAGDLTGGVYRVAL